VSSTDDRLRQQHEVDEETSASTEAMVGAVGAARDRSLDRREAALDNRERRLDDREAELDERDAAQGRREGTILDRLRDADERDRLADQREINAETARPDDPTPPVPG
jgi:hypothetical protein